MARHSSFKTIIAYETYHNFFAIVRARQRAHQDPPTWELEGDWAISGESQPPGQAGGLNAEAALPFSSIEGLPIHSPKAESWIESWLSGKNGGPGV